jgi:hypothetical protein
VKKNKSRRALEDRAILQDFAEEMNLCVHNGV